MTYWENIIWDKVSTDIKKEFDSKTVYNKNVLKTKIKSYRDEATDFPDKEMPMSFSSHTCLTVITIDSALTKDEIYYLQVFLKECKYTKKEVIRHITEDLEISSGNSDESDEE